MDFARLSEQRDLFITDNLISILELPATSLREYEQAISTQNEPELSRIERMVDVAMRKLHTNYWDDYIVMVAHFIFRERRRDLVSCLLRGRLFAPLMLESLLSPPPSFTISQRQIEDALMERYQSLSPRRVLSISQAIEHAIC